MLGALALLALSTTAEDQDKAVELAGKDILIREVRDAKKFKKSRKGGKKTSIKKNNKKKESRKAKGNGRVKGKRKNGGQRSRKEGGKRKKGGRRTGNTKSKEGKKGKRRNRTRKGGKSPATRRNTRQDTCTTFYNKDNTTAVRDFRYARNQIQKAKRAKKRVEKLDKLMEKAATAFLAGAAFYKNCPGPEAKVLYDGLSKCNVTAANACNAAALKNTTDYADLDVCITALETTMNSSENCLSKGACGSDGTCNYVPIGMEARTCDYISFDQDVAKRLNKNCTASDVVGSFTYCNNLLKDNFAVASNCSTCSSTVTTVAPSAGRLRKNLNIWNV